MSCPGQFNPSPGEDLVPIAEEAGWARARLHMCGKSCPNQDSIQ